MSSSIKLVVKKFWHTFVHMFTVYSSSTTIACTLHLYFLKFSKIFFLFISSMENRDIYINKMTWRHLFSHGVLIKIKSVEWRNKKVFIIFTYLDTLLSKDSTNRRTSNKYHESFSSLSLLLYGGAYTQQKTCLYFTGGAVYA